MNTLDSAPYHESAVVNPYFDWATTSIRTSHITIRDLRSPRTRHDQPQHGRAAGHSRNLCGSAYPSVIEYLKKLGVTAIELMPIHQFVNDSFLQEKGLSNYWDSTPSASSPAQRVFQLRTAWRTGQRIQIHVKAYHHAGMEVILDVVYNHTAEGNNRGPTLSFKGIDNGAYYRLVDNDRRHYFDTTGTGNSLLMRSPHALQLITDSLRYWVTECTSTDSDSILPPHWPVSSRKSTNCRLLRHRRTGSVISRVKLIAEPWDLGSGGYQVGASRPAGPNGTAATAIACATSGARSRPRCRNSPADSWAVPTCIRSMAADRSHP